MATANFTTLRTVHEILKSPQFEIEIIRAQYNRK